ncbi:hypothetical protein FDZ84_02465 [Saccharopolyspora sp. ASAGF58]|nr:hypothetical protein FDZ84_02465 [Saccharopolyspora sp. ASAGF58]
MFAHLPGCGAAELLSVPLVALTIATLGWRWAFTGLTSSFVLPLLIVGEVALTGAAVYAFPLPPVRRLRMG